MQKVCIKCNQSKLLSEYFTVIANKSGYEGKCKDCKRLYQKQYSQNNRERLNQAQRKHYKNNPVKVRRKLLRKRFKISLEQYEAMLKLQDFACSICKVPQSALKKSLCVDHCHKTLKIRGLLCGKCNQALGLLNDNISNLSSAITYLKESVTDVSAA